MRIWVVAAVAGAWICGAASAETVELVTGDKIEGTVLERRDDRIVMEHPVLGRLEIPIEQVKPAEEQKINPGLFGTSFLEGWSCGVSAGWNASSGKSRTQNLNADLGINRETDWFRGDFVAKYYFSESEKETQDNQFDARYTHDFLFDGFPLFPFLSPHYRYDSQQDWNHRLGADAGVGWEFVKTEKWEGIARLGAGVARTLKDDRDTAGPIGARVRVGDDPIRTEWNGLVSLFAAWRYMKGQSLSVRGTYQPDFADLPLFRAIGNAEWKVAVGAIEGLSFKAGIDYIYDAHEQGRKNNDRKYYAALVYDF